MKKIILISIIIIAFNKVSQPCNICGGGTGDVAVLALDGRMLFNLGFSFDSFIGIWDQYGVWRASDYTKTQSKFTVNFAYRINKHFQFSFSVPYLLNHNNTPGIKQNGNGLGDITISGRYEFFHEYQIKKRNNKTYIDNAYPYLALTFGVTLPTGKSDETAKNDVDVIGKGYVSTSLGVSLIKSIIKNRLQVSTDLSWQHNFSKTYDQYFGEPLSTSFTKRSGDKFNYNVSLNYIFSSWHSVSVSASGFSQSSYTLGESKIQDTDERSLSFAAAYTYYPSRPFRITSSIKWTLPSNNIGKNAPGSTTFGINFTYYIPDYNIK